MKLSSEAERKRFRARDEGSDYLRIRRWLGLKMRELGTLISVSDSGFKLDDTKIYIYIYISVLLINFT